jgi:peptidoglycan hydrolase-like protein with peptidoglycan-binding domain
MKLFTKLFFVFAIALVPSTGYAKHACQINAPLENCSHEKSLCTDILTSQRLGNKNTSVTKLQEYLFTYRYLTVTPTGYFGTKTQEAVVAFQKAHGIDTTGFVGPLTRAQFKKNSCNLDTITQESSPMTPVVPVSENTQNSSIWNTWTSTKLSPLSENAMSALKQALGAVGVNTNFATTTLTEQEIIDITKKFERDYILNK